MTLRLKTLICGIAGALSLGALTILGLEIEVAGAIACFVMVVFALMILPDTTPVAGDSSVDNASTLSLYGSIDHPPN